MICQNALSRLEVCLVDLLPFDSTRSHIIISSPLPLDHTLASPHDFRRPCSILATGRDPFHMASGAGSRPHPFHTPNASARTTDAAPFVPTGTHRCLRAIDVRAVLAFHFVETGSGSIGSNSGDS